MLLNIHIRNYALIDDLRLEFVKGLNIFSGETGAGKSIIIESLNLILGARASTALVRKGAERCVITAEFDCSRLDELRGFLTEAGLSGFEDGSLIIRREIDAAGKSRAFINDTPVTIATLEKAGAWLIDVHGQHEHQSLLKNSYQRALLDTFGCLDEKRAQVGDACRQWRDLVAQQQSTQLSEQERQRRIDLYSFQLNEIDAAQLKPGEEEEIENILPQLKNAEKLAECGREAHRLLYTIDGSVMQHLNRVQKLLETIRSLGGTIDQTAESFSTAYYQIEEAAREIESFTDSLSMDPEQLNELLCRQDLIAKLKRKYGRTIEEILAYRATICTELDTLVTADRTRQELDEKILKAMATLDTLCNKLSEARKKTGAKLATAVEAELADLGMKKARVAVNLLRLPEPGPEGSDTVEFMFSANVGEDVQPIKAIASGGEMSRVMLAMKTILANADAVPVMIFDEVDAGVGGPTGQVIGRKLKNLSQHRQILCITHLPQIAAFGDRNFSVAKASRSNRTFTEVKTLTSAEHREEIARMLSGENITETARKHADELIEKAR